MICNIRASEPAHDDPSDLLQTIAAPTSECRSEKRRATRDSFPIHGPPARKERLSAPAAAVSYQPSAISQEPAESCRLTAESYALDVVVEVKLVRVRAEGDGIDLALALVA